MTVSWKKQIAAAISGGILFLQSAAAMAAPAQDLTLDDSIAAALKNNSAIKMAVSDQEKAQSGVSEAKAGNLPTVGVGIGGTRGQNQEASPVADSYSTSLKMNWPLYSGGRTEGAINQAKLNAESAELGVAKTQQQIKLDATTAYYNALQNRSLVNVNQEMVDDLTEHLNKVQAQFNAGVVAKSDVLRSEVELANAQQNLTKAQNAFDLAISTLNNTIGASLDTAYNLKDELAYVKSDESLEDSIQQALANRPEIQQAQNSVDSAKEGIRIADSGRLPSVNFSAGQAWSGDEFPGKNSNWSMSVMANWNVLDSGLTSAKVKQAQASLEKTNEQQEQTRDAIELEVRQAYLSMKEAESRIESTQVAVDKAAEDVKIARTKYYAGVGTNLDVIDAELALTQARTNYNQALYDYNVNKAKLQKAVGASV